MSDPIPETKFDHLQKQISYVPKYIQDESIILEVRNLKKFFPIEKGIFFKKTIAEIKAVDDISFILHKGETLGIVGESGSGKSTLAKTISQIYSPTFGEIWLKGINLNQVENQKSKEIAKILTLVFQETMKSLDPRMTVLQTILEPLEIQKRLPNKIRYSKAKDLLLAVGLSPNIAFRYPHELSGGQLQRICIARALSYQPEIIIFDEPVSSLDVSLQASVINTLVNIQDKLNLTYIFIAHDLTVIRKISHRVLIMYLGKIMEIGESDQIYENAMHPYTQALLSTILIPDPDVEPTKSLLHGELPTPINPPPGCLFCTRCRFVRKKCYFEEPILEEVESEHLVACHFYKEIKSGLHLPTEKLGENSDY